MTLTTQFESTIAEITDVPTEDFQHPFLTKVKFIFTDNLGNANKQGIESEDFDEIAKSSINMPIKIRYTHEGAGGHDRSVPIGHITKMYKQSDASASVDQLIGEAVLYKEEYPDEVEYLKNKFDEGKAPGISWELAYRESISKAGVEWLKGVVTKAATFVRFPAYGNRTTILAMAQDSILTITESQMADEEFMSELKEIVQELNDLVQGKPEEEDEDETPSLTMGGMNVEELEKVQGELAAAVAQVAELTEKIKEVTELNNELAKSVEEFTRAALVAERTAKVVEAGIKIDTDQEKLAKKQEIWLAMSPEIFEAYVADLAEASKPAEPPKGDASASRIKEGLPKFSVAGADTTLDDLKSIGRRASRGIAADL